MEKVGDIVTLEEMRTKMDSRNRMLLDARAGKIQYVLNVKKVILSVKETTFFYCDSPECDMKLSMDPERPKQE